MSDKNKIVLERLKKLIDTTTREEIAQALNCDTSLITKHYNGNREITVDYVVKYAKYFGLSTDYLLGTTDAQTPVNTDEGRLVRSICDYTGLSEEAVYCLTTAMISQKQGCKTSTEYLKFLNAFLISNSNWNCAVSFLLESYKNSLIKQTICLKTFTEEYINNTDLSIIDIINKRATEVKQVEKETKFLKYETIEAFEDFINEYLAPELKAYNEAFERYIETIDSIYKSKTAKLFVEEENITNANNNETQ